MVESLVPGRLVGRRKGDFPLFRRDYLGVGPGLKGTLGGHVGNQRRCCVSVWKVRSRIPQEIPKGDHRRTCGAITGGIIIPSDVEHPVFVEYRKSLEHHESLHVSGFHSRPESIGGEREVALAGGHRFTSCPHCQVRNPT